MNVARGPAGPLDGVSHPHTRATRRLRRGFAAIVLALLCVMFITFTGAARLSKAERWYAHTYQVLAELNRLQADLNVLDSGARSWASLGDPFYHTRCLDALTDYHTRLNSLLELTADNRVQQPRLKRLKSLCASWEQSYVLPLLHRQRHGRPGVVSLSQVTKVVAAMRRARPQLIQIQALTSALRSHEVTQLRERTAEQLNSQRAAGWSLVVATLFVVLLLGGLFTMLDRSTTRTLLANARLEDEIDEHASAERRLKDSQARLTALIENTPDNIWSIDTEYRLINFNSAFSDSLARRTGKPPYIGQDMTPYFNGDNAHRKDWYDQAFAGEQLRVEESYESDGIIIENELSFSPIETDGPRGRLITGATIFSRDITERKKVDRLKNEFIATVSHELRTPLTSIRGSLGLLRSGVTGELPEAAKPLIDIAVNNAERLVRLINDILDIEKIESGKIDFELRPMELLPLVQRAIDGAHGYGSEMNVRFELRDELPPGAQICADEDRFIQVMDNLLSNAAKFSPPGDAVLVCLARHENAFRVSVHDKGEGVPPEFHDRIFSRFAQADGSNTRPKGGTGLGLSIVQAIVEKFGGTIDFDRSGGPGCTFFFDLPEWHNAAPLPQGIPDGARVLICEDDADIGELLRLMLHAIGFEADIAPDLQSAREHLRSRARAAAESGGAIPNYHALTLDLNLPDGDGISFIRALRGDSAMADLPVIVVSATATAGRRALEGDAVGVVDWLEKPIDTGRLQNAVRRAANGAHRTPGQRPRVLHIEDDPDVVRVAGEILQADAEVDTARGFAAACAKLAGNVYDLVILDIALPDGDGLELLSQLKNATHPTPVVVFSASELSREDARRAEAALVKSRTSNETLRHTIQSLISRN